MKNMNKFQGVLLLTMVALCQSNDTNYCNMKGCDKNKHFMCRYENKRTSCTGGFEELPWPDSMKIDMVNIWNLQRSRIMSGTQLDYYNKTYPKAYGFPRLIWHHKLENIAKVMAIKCTTTGQFADACTWTDDFQDLGTMFIRYDGKVKEGVKEHYGSLRYCAVPPEDRLESYKHPTAGNTDFVSWWRCHYLIWYLNEAVGCYSVYRKSEGYTYAYCVLSSNVINYMPLYLRYRPDDRWPEPDCGCFHGWVESPGCLCERIKADPEPSVNISIKDPYTFGFFRPSKLNVKIFFTNPPKDSDVLNLYHSASRSDLIGHFSKWSYDYLRQRMYDPTWFHLILVRGNDICIHKILFHGKLYNENLRTTAYGLDEKCLRDDTCIMEVDLTNLCEKSTNAFQFQRDVGTVRAQIDWSATSLIDIRHKKGLPKHITGYTLLSYRSDNSTFKNRPSELIFGKLNASSEDVWTVNGSQYSSGHWIEVLHKRDEFCVLKSIMKNGMVLIPHTFDCKKRERCLLELDMSKECK